MARVYFDRQGNTLTIWLDDLEKEHVCEELDDDVILMKDRHNRTIGLECIDVLSVQSRR